MTGAFAMLYMRFVPILHAAYVKHFAETIAQVSGTPESDLLSELPVALEVHVDLDADSVCEAPKASISFENPTTVWLLGSESTSS